MKLRSIIAVALALALAACGGGGTTSNAPADQPADQPTAAAVAEEPTDEPAPTEAPAEEEAAAAALNTPVEFDDSTWMVTSAEDKGQELKADNEFIQPITTTGRFIQVGATVKATGSDNVMVSAPKIVDSQGREFDSSSDAIMVLPAGSACVLEQINPGIEKSCTWVYEVPADAAGLLLRIAPSMFGDTKDVNLGL